MGELVLDESLKYLKEAQSYMNMITELDSFQEIFEADNPEVQKQMAVNQEAGEKSVSSLRKAIDAIKNMIKNIIDAISNFFKELLAPQEEKEAYAAFKEKCKQDPSLKNKKITITDYRKVMEGYDKLIEEAEAMDREIAKGKEANIDVLAKKVKSFIGGAATGLTMTVGVDVARNLARSNKNMAKLINSQLSNDGEIMNTISNSLSEKEAKRFKKDIKAFGQKISLRRIIISLRRKKCDCVMDCIRQTEKGLKELFSIGGFFKSVTSRDGLAHIAMQNDQIGEIVGGVKTAANIGISAGFQAGKEIHDEKKAIKKAKKKQERLDKKHAKGDHSEDSTRDFLLGDKGKEKVNKVVDKIDSGIDKVTSGVKGGINKVTSGVKSKFTNNKNK